MRARRLPAVSVASISERARFDHVRYANCWEDADVVCEALAAVPGDRVLSIAHSRETVEELMREKDDETRRAFYERRWDSWRWRAIFRAFFSRAVLGWIGRDPEFFRLVSGPVSARFLDRARHALTAPH